MNFSTKSIKRSFFLFTFVFAFSHLGMSQGTGVWTGANDTFTKAAYAKWTSAQNQDRITDSVWITRKDQEGIFNIKVSGGYTSGQSPRRTKWSYGKSSNYKSLNFQDWENAINSNPPGQVNKDMVMLIVKDSIYIDVRFKSWTQAAQGGGFSYIRSTDCRSFDDKKVSICDSFVSPSKKYVWKKSGTYYDTLTNRNSCDSIITFDLEILGQDSGKIFMSGCGFASLPLSKRKVYATGTYTDTLVNGTVCGRDSILVANIFIYTVPTKSITVTACDSFVSPSGKKVWTTSGKYEDVLVAAATCDTALTVNLTINYSKVTKIQHATCDSFISVTQRVYTQTGNYLDTLQTSLGCDSIIDLDLTITKSSLTKISPTVCSVSYVSPSGKHEWGVSGLYYDTLMSGVGCDSVLEINLTVDPYNELMNVSSCDPWTSPSEKHVYDQSGIYQDTLTASDLCDSLVLIVFTKLDPTTDTIKVLAAINKYHSPSGRYVWTTNGTYTDTIPNQAGCDSVITFDNLTIASFSLDVTENGNDLTAVATGVDYQWLDCDDSYSKVIGATSKTFSVTKKGRYAVELGNEWNTDTSDCIEMTLGVDQLQNPYDIQLYPNPNNGIFTLDLSKIYQEVENIQVFNTKGEILYENHDISELMDLNLLNRVSSGIYFVRIVGTNFSYNTSVVIR
jgi:Secretion system C-terminal sorting domain